MLGSAPYSVSKHGAVAFAEWLRATYGHRGIVVQAICPQGVRTRMLDEAGPLKNCSAATARWNPRRSPRSSGTRSRATASSSCPSRGGRLPGPSRGPRRVAGRHGPAAGQARRGSVGMRAWRIESYGEPAAALRQAEAAPAACPRQLRVRSSRPCELRRAAVHGEYQIRPTSFTPGVEGCGEVVAVGAEVSGFEVGERVVGTCVLPHGSFARRSADGGGGDLPGAAVWTTRRRRGSSSPTRPAGSPCTSGRDCSRARPCSSTRPPAGWARPRCSWARRPAPGRRRRRRGAKAEVARRCGADVVLDRHTDDVVAVVKEVTRGRGADVVFDPVGGDTYTPVDEMCCLRGPHRRGGVRERHHAVASARPRAGEELRDPRPPLGLYAQVDPARVQAAHEQLVRLVAEGAVAPVVGERVPFDGLAEGVQRLADGITVGRVVWEA